MWRAYARPVKPQFRTSVKCNLWPGGSRGPACTWRYNQVNSPLLGPQPSFIKKAPFGPARPAGLFIVGSPARAGLFHALNRSAATAFATQLPGD